VGACAVAEAPEEEEGKGGVWRELDDTAGETEGGEEEGGALRAGGAVSGLFILPGAGRRGLRERKRE
jgi:hypothetical protein